MLNCNVPKDADGRFAICRMGVRRYLGERVTHRQDPRGNDYFWIGGTEVHHAGELDSDTAAHDRGLISVMPIRHDLTAHKALAELGEIRLDGQAPVQLSMATGDE